MNKILNNKKTLLFDGAMGTYLAEKYNENVELCERLNIDNPSLILQIHKEYISAHADAIKTNTFSANTVSLGSDFKTVETIIEKACDIAALAVKDTSTLVFASIGPIENDDITACIAEHKKIIDCFLNANITNFIFETFSEYETLLILAAYIKEKSENSFVITECTINADKYSKRGISALEILSAMKKAPQIDACGFNCTCGPLHLLEIVKELSPFEKPISIMPNASYPALVNGRSVYKSSPDYFAEKLCEIHSYGVNILGGCCGTTPLYIKAARKLLDENTILLKKEIKVPLKAQKVIAEPNKKRMLAVELDSPLDTDMDYFFKGAKELAASGADLITVADCPLSRARMDSSLLSAKLNREFSIAAMPHLTCRDRNINATKALLLALHMEGIKNVLIVTGDPIPSADRHEVKGVFNFNSVMLATFINDLNKTVFAENPFIISGALNVNAVNFEAELGKAKRKETAGVTRFLTQPIYTKEAIENLKRAKKELKSSILAGIMPVVSHKNALFLNNEVAGITIPESLISSLEKANKLEAAEIAANACIKIARSVQSFCDGYYMITPLKRVDIIKKIMEGLQ